MTHKVSPKGIIGLGALGRALETFIPEAQDPPAAVLFAVKAFDLERAITENIHRWPESTPFVTLCNGYIWPILARLGPALGKRPVRVGMTTIGSTIKSDGTLDIFSKGTVTAWGHWGSSNAAPSAGELTLLHRFPDGQWHDDIRPMIRQKWILNVVINTLAAAYHLPANRNLTAHRAEAETLLSEAITIANKLWPDLAWDKTPEDLSAKLWDVVAATAGNENSMARDARLGRRTESDVLAGLAVNDKNCPRLTALHQLITARIVTRGQTP